MVSFTGSTRAGTAVAASAAPTVKRVAQELGGKSPNIILPSADLEAAVKGGVEGCFGNTGQSCDAPTRMFVSRAQQDKALAYAKEAAAAVVVGDPRNTETTMGPLVSKLQFDKVQRLIQTGIDEGATLVTGGTGRPAGLNRGWFVQPTIFGNVTNEMTIAREEIFGPVLSVITATDHLHAVRIANDSPYGLAASLWTSNLSRAHSMIRALRAGSVWVNCFDGGDITMPFGGYKQSGNGRDRSLHALDKYSELKSAWIDLQA